MTAELRERALATRALVAGWLVSLACWLTPPRSSDEDVQAGISLLAARLNCRASSLRHSQEADELRDVRRGLVR